MARITWFSSLLILILTACAEVEVHTYDDAFKSEGGPYVRDFAASAEDLYAAASRAVLGNNFRIEKEDAGRRNFVAAKYTTDGDKTVVLAVSVYVKDEGNGKSIAFTSAVQTVNKTRITYSYFYLPLIALISIQTPIRSGSTATTTKEEEKTVDNPDFYSRLFKSIDNELLKWDCYCW